MAMNDYPHRLLTPSSEWRDPDICVADAGDILGFSVHDAFMYHGYDSPGGVALGWRLMQRAFALLSPGEIPERREFSVFTSFPGLGFRDAVELVTRMVSGNRFSVNPGFTDTVAQDGVAGKFFFRFLYRGRSVELAPMPGYPGEDFIRLGRASKRADFTPEEAEQWRAAKFSLAAALLGAGAEAVIRVL